MQKKHFVLHFEQRTIKSIIFVLENTIRGKIAGSRRTTPRVGLKPSAYSFIVIRCRTYTGANIQVSLRTSKYLKQNLQYSHEKAHFRT